MQNIAEALAKVSVETLIENSCVPPKRADILLGGAVWLTTLMKTLGIEKIVVSDSDNLEGYARSRGLL
ncbi:MAG: hypothetical protein IJX98_06630 [Clostridia bacterium]|nr:hypothetical protein [Clostridia bacterium]